MTSRFLVEAFEKAYELALESLSRDEVPVGAVIIKEEKIISCSGNFIRSRKNPAAHAEILAIQEAASLLQNERLGGCELVTTLEPCAMCTGAAILARLEKVHFLAFDEKLPALRKITGLPGHNHELKWQHHELSHIPYVETLQNFFRKKRKAKSS